MAWKCEIAGVDKTAYLAMQPGVQIDTSANERRTATFTTVHGYIPEQGATVTLYDTDGTTPIFTGVILSRRITGVGLLNWAECQCAGWELYLDHVSVTLSYASDPTLKDVLDDIVTALADYSITLDAAQVDGPTMDPFTWAPMRCSDALRELTKVTGYVWTLAADKTLRMVRPGGNEFTNGRFLDASLTSEAGGNGADWAQGAGDDGVTWALGTNFIGGGTNYFPATQGWGAAYARYIGTPPANTYRSMGGQVFPVSAGTAYAFTGFLACHQMRDIALGITWRTAGDVDISTDYSDVVISTETSGLSAAEDLAEYGFAQASATAPGTATKAYVFIRGRHPVSAGGTNPYMFWTGLWFGRLADRVTWAVTDAAAEPYCTSLTWSDPTSSPATKAILRCGPSGTFQTVRTWVADGSQDDFVGYVPAAGPTIGYVTVGGVTQTVGYGETAEWQWDEATTTLSRDTASRPTAGTVVSLTYTGRGPFDITADNGGTPPVEHLELRPEELSYTAALASTASAILLRVGQVTQDVELVGLRTGMAVNRTLRVASVVRGLIAEVILTDVSTTLITDLFWEWSARGTTGTYVGESALQEFRS